MTFQLCEYFEMNYHKCDNNPILYIFWKVIQNAFENVK